jgi:hypothetical protein
MTECIDHVLLFAVFLVAHLMLSMIAYVIVHAKHHYLLLFTVAYCFVIVVGCGVHVDLLLNQIMSQR